MHRASSIKGGRGRQDQSRTPSATSTSRAHQRAVHHLQPDAASTPDVLDAAGTKWNFLKFQPGPGGRPLHREVDPYLVYKAKGSAATPRIVDAGAS